MPSPPRLVLGLLGPGQVGSALLRQIHAAAPRLRDEGRADLRVAALATSRRMRRSRDFADPVHAARALREGGDREGREGGGGGDAAGEELQLDTLAAHLRETADEIGGVPILVDATASDEVADRYAGWLAAGIHLVTANKRGGSGPLDRYRRIRRSAREGGTRWRYEATVGAGLPVLSTLQDLLATGDEVVAIEGVLSGTLAFLLSAWEAGEPFSEAVARARTLGYTEPDPRDDLSGMDVARKLVILAREAGGSLELGQLRVEGLVPEELRDGSAASFLARLEALDGPVGRRLGALAGGGEEPEAADGLRRVRYLARYRPGGEAEVGPVALPATHPLALLGPTGNAVAFTTRRYDALPLVIQGPGAGPEVTAAGIFADLLRIGRVD